jgi:hypothetical protein
MTTTSTEKQTKSHQSRAKAGSAPSSKRAAKSKSSGTKATAKPSARKAPRVDPDVQAKVQDYLDRFCDAMTAGDTKTMGSLWSVPAFVVDKKDTRIISDTAEVETFFAGAPEMYAQRGIEDTRAEIQTLDMIADTLVMVTVRWPYIDAEGEEIGEESSTYTLKADDSGNFMMVVCTMRGEQNGDTESYDELAH